MAGLDIDTNIIRFLTQRLEKEKKRRILWQNRFECLLDRILCNECLETYHSYNAFWASGQNIRPWVPTYGCCAHNDHYFILPETSSDVQPVDNGVRSPIQELGDARQMERRNTEMWRNRVGILLAGFLCETCKESKADAWNTNHTKRIKAWLPTLADNCNSTCSYVKRMFERYGAIKRDWTNAEDL